MIPQVTKKTPFYKNIPHAITMLFGIMIVVSVLTYILPAGHYQRILVEGKNVVVPNSYTTMASTPIGIFDMFRAIPLGFKSAVEIIFIVLAGAIMFSFMEASKAIENGVGTLVQKLGVQKKRSIIIIMTFVYGLMGVAVGYENNIAMVPIAAVLSLAIGGDLILAAGISVGAMTIGFGLSPINPYTVGTGHKIAQLAMFSGAPLRAVLCFTGISIMAWFNLRYFKKITREPERSLAIGLDTSGITLTQPLADYKMTRQNWWVVTLFLTGLVAILYGVFVWHWYINELSAVFLMIGLLCGLVSRMNATQMSLTTLRAVSLAAPGAFMVGFATTIKVLMDMGNIGDTISYELSELLQGLPLHLAAICMSISQTVINFFIPSGSGQALATLPVMLPLGESLGLTRQTTILAFQIGDGVSNLVNPTLGGLIAMLSMCRVSIDRWIRFIFPVVIFLMGISFVALIIAVSINYK